MSIKTAIIVDKTLEFDSLFNKDYNLVIMPSLSIIS
jgi:hypothetical protein